MSRLVTPVGASLLGAALLPAEASGCGRKSHPKAQPVSFPRAALQVAHDVRLLLNT